MYLTNWIQEWAKVKVIGGCIVLGVLILGIIIFGILCLIKK